MRFLPGTVRQDKCGEIAFVSRKTGLRRYAARAVNDHLWYLGPPGRVVWALEKIEPILRPLETQTPSKHSLAELRVLKQENPAIVPYSTHFNNCKDYPTYSTYGSLTD